MSCEICACDTSVDSVLWTCTGCPRKFHAACVGVTVQRGSLRKRDRRVVDVSQYVLPCCDSCQELLLAKMNFRELVEQQKLLEKQLHSNTEVLHRFSLHQKTPNVVQEAIEGMEVLLAGIKDELSAINKTSTLAGSVLAIQNHCTSLHDSALTATKETICASLKAMTSDLSTDLRNINNEISQLNQLSIETAANINMNVNSMLGIDVLDELKALSANIMDRQRRPSSLDTLPSLDSNSCPSLDAELIRSNMTSPSAPLDQQPAPERSRSIEHGYMKYHVGDPGWRILGKSWVWRADWSVFPEFPETAKKRKNKQRNHNKNNNSSNARRKQKNHVDIVRSNFNNRSRYPTVYNNNLNCSNNQRRTQQLPPDRVLLAEAKERFSRPPTHYRPTINFERGEILNPYSANDGPQAAVTTRQFNRTALGASPAVTCECACRHSCFLQN